MVFDANLIAGYNYFFFTHAYKTLVCAPFRQRKWPLLAPVRKIMALGRKKMALGCKEIYGSIHEATWAIRSLLV